MPSVKLAPMSAPSVVFVRENLSQTIASEKDTLQNLPINFMLMLCGTPSDVESVYAKDRHLTTLRDACTLVEAADGKQYVTRLRVAVTADVASMRATDQPVAGQSAR